MCYIDQHVNKRIEEEQLLLATTTEQVDISLQILFSLTGIQLGMAGKNDEQFYLNS
jgi:hypothetical protein